MNIKHNQASLIKADSVKKNIIFQFAYQAIMLVIPLVISPYLTRVLGETSLGIYSYTNSIAYYFVMFSMLGISKHGQRIIATRRDNIIELRKTYWSLFFLHVVVSLFCLAIYLICCIFVFKENKPIYFAQALYVFSALFDIVWFFYGIEQFKIVVIRNSIIKILELVLIFCFIKSKNDVLTYTLIMSGSILLSQICVIPTAIKAVPPIRFSLSNVKEHIRPMLALSIAVIAIGLYTVFDKTLLGILATKEEVAFYEYSNRIINIPKTFIGVIGTVLFPRACNYIANNNFAEAKRYYKYSLLAIYFIGFASIFGLLGIAGLFSILYYGQSFAVCGNIMKAMSPLVLIIGMGEIIRLQFLIPLKKDALYTTCIIVNAIINIVISFVLIPRIGVYGAVIGTVSAELFGMLFQGYLVRHYIDIKDTIKTALPFLLSGVVMYFVLNILKGYYPPSMLFLVIQIMVGAVSYLSCLSIWYFLVDANKTEYRLYFKQILKKKNSIK